MSKKPKSVNKPAATVGGNIVHKDLLMSALQRVQPGLAKKDTLPQSSSFVFKGGMVYTYNDEVSVRAPCAVPFEGAVEGKPFFDLLSRCNIPELAFTISDQELRIEGARMRVGLPLDQSIELPLDEVAEPEAWLSIPDGLFEGVKLCAFAASKDVSNPILTCLNVVEGKVEASDGYRYSRYALTGKVSVPFAIPADSAKIMVRYEPTKCGLAKGWAHFKNPDGVVFSCRTFEDKFPSEQLEAATAKVSGPTLRLPKQLKEILDRAVIFATSEFKTDPQVAISCKAGRAAVKAQGPHGVFRETCKMTKTQAEFRFEIPPAFLKEILDLRAEVTIGDAHLRFVTGPFTHLVCLMVSDSPEAGDA